MRRNQVERDVVLAVLALSLGSVLGACSKSDESPKTSASTTASGSAAAAAPAGHVLEVAGTVTVAGKQLAKGDSVGAEDTVDTGPDGSVTIELVHNLARWELGSGKHVRVRESLAWKEPKRTEPVAQVEQDTASAGRPAERAAAGTVASTEGFAGSDAEKAKSGDKPQKTGSTETKASKEAVKAKFDKLMGGKNGSLGGVLGGGGSNDPLGGSLEGQGGLGLKGTGLGGGGAATGGIGIGNIGHGQGSGYGNSSGPIANNAKPTPAIHPATPVVMGQLAPEIIRRIVKSRFPNLRFCYEKGLQSNPGLTGKLNVKFVISPEGTVTSAADNSSTIADTNVVSCMVGVFKILEFPKPKGGGIVIVNYPIVFDTNP